MKRKLTPPPLFPLFFSLAAGIMAGYARPPDFPLWGLLAGAITLVFLCLLVFFRTKRLVFILCIFFLVWGCVSIDRAVYPHVGRNHILNFADHSSYTITGTVVSFSRKFAHKKQYILSDIFLSSRKGSVFPVNGNIIFNLYPGKKNKAVSPVYGDRIRFTSSLRAIRNFSNPGGFDYEQYMGFKGIFGSAYAGRDRVELVTEYPLTLYFKTMQAIEKARNNFFEFLNKSKEHPEAAAVVAAMVTGKKESILPDLRDTFSKAGSAHILAISGLHLSILALVAFGLIHGVLRQFSCLVVSGAARKAAGILTLVPLFVYAMFSGFAPSTQRAFIMTAVFMVSFLMEKENDPLNTLALAGIIILSADSTALFSISFQLSFAALASIIMGFSFLGEWQWLKKKTPASLVVSAALVSLFAGIGTFPLIAGYFNMVSHVQVAANLVMVPVMGFVCLPLGFLILGILFISPALSQALSFVCLELVSACIGFLKVLTGFWFSWSRIVTLSPLEMLLVYLGLGAGLLILAGRKKTGGILLGAALVSLVGGAVLETRARFFPSKMTVTVLDVGQGNASLIHTIDGHAILVDGGGFSGRTGFDTGRYLLAPFLWGRNIKTLDAVILTHPEADHMKGLVYILENFKVKLMVKTRDKRSGRAYGDLIRLCREKGIPIWNPDPGDAFIGFGRTGLEFYPKGPGQNYIERNNNSLVFQVRFNEFSMLFPGDIHIKRERQLVGLPGSPSKAQVIGGLPTHRGGYSRKDAPASGMESTVLLSPHHGSRTSSSYFFLDHVNPESVIVSCGFKNRYGFPHPDVLKRYQKRGCRVYRTDLDGALSIISDGRGYTITPHKGE